jgi:hypothetical protein
MKRCASGLSIRYAFFAAIRILDAGEVVNVKLKVIAGSVANAAVEPGTGKAIKLQVNLDQTGVTIAGPKAKPSDLKRMNACHCAVGRAEVPVSWNFFLASLEPGRCFSQDSSIEPIKFFKQVRCQIICLSIRTK